MLLNELHGYKQYQDMKFRQILIKLLDENDAKFDSGAFGVVIIPKDKNYVYKMWIQDSGYEGFYKLAMKHQDNPFFPKFIGKKRLMPAFFKRTADALMNIVKMEKLIPDPNYEWMQVLKLAAQTKPGEVTPKMVADTLKMWIAGTDGKIELDEIYKKFYRGRYSREKFNEEYRYLFALLRKAALKMKKDEHLIPKAFETIQLLQTAHLESNLRFDMHSGNFMQRPNGETVITDPFASVNEIVQMGKGTMIDLYFDTNRVDDESKILSGRPSKEKKSAAD